MGARRDLGRRGLVRLGTSEFRGIRPHYPGEPLKPHRLEGHGKDRHPHAARDGRPDERRRHRAARRHGVASRRRGAADQLRARRAGRRLGGRLRPRGRSGRQPSAARQPLAAAAPCARLRRPPRAARRPGRGRARRESAAVGFAAEAALERRTAGANADPDARGPVSRPRARARPDRPAQRGPARVGHPRRRRLLRVRAPPTTPAGEEPEPAGVAGRRRRALPHARTRRRSALGPVAHDRAAASPLCPNEVLGQAALLHLLRGACRRGGAEPRSRRAGPPSPACSSGAALAAALAGAPGLIHRRAWPAALVLLPAGAYLVAAGAGAHPGRRPRTRRAVRASTSGSSAPRHRRTRRTPSPSTWPARPELKLLLSLVVYSATGLASFVALSLRRALPAVAIFLVLLGFSLTVDGTGRVVLLPLAFLLLAGCLLTLSRSLERRRWASAGVTAGAATAVTASLLALFLLAATPGGGQQAVAGLEHLGSDRSELVAPGVQLDAELPEPPRPQDRRHSHPGRVARRLVLAGQRPRLLQRRRLAQRQPVREPAHRRRGPPVPTPTTFPPAVPFPPARTVTELYKIQSLYTDFLFAGGTPTALVFEQHVPVFSDERAGAAACAAAGTADLTYGLTAVIPQLKATDLVARGRDYPLARPAPTPRCPSRRRPR